MSHLSGLNCLESGPQNVSDRLKNMTGKPTLVPFGITNESISCPEAVWIDELRGTTSSSPAWVGMDKIRRMYTTLEEKDQTHESAYFLYRWMHSERFMHNCIEVG